MNYKGFDKIAKAFGKAKPEKTRAGHERIYMDEASLMPAPSAAMGKKPPSPAERMAAKKAGRASGAVRRAKSGLLGK